MALLRRLADNSRPGSLSNTLRRRRWRMFLDLVRDVPRPLRVLDVGGTQNFWDHMDPTGELGFELVLLNLTSQEVTRPNTQAVIGDAADMSPFPDKAFDVVISNSVIEHLPDPVLQERMASEIRRVGRRYYVQTPNRYFPLEPHFLFPLFQFLPLRIQIFLLTHRALGWYEKQPTRAAAREVATSIRLVSGGELNRWFPSAKIHRERLLGVAKSFIVMGRD